MGESDSVHGKQPFLIHGDEDGIVSLKRAIGVHSTNTTG